MDARDGMRSRVASENRCRVRWGIGEARRRDGDGVPEIRHEAPSQRSEYQCSGQQPGAERRATLLLVPLVLVVAALEARVSGCAAPGAAEHA